MAARSHHGIYETPLLFSAMLDEHEHGRVLDANHTCIEGLGHDRHKTHCARFWECGWWARTGRYRRGSTDEWSRCPPPVIQRVTTGCCLGDGRERFRQSRARAPRRPMYEEPTTYIVATGVDMTSYAAPTPDLRA